MRSEFLDVSSLKLTKGEKKIIKYIKANPKLVSNMTLKELSTIVSVGEATIIRLTQKMSCSGFSDFKVKLAAYAALLDRSEREGILDERINQGDSTDIIGEKLAFLCQNKLNDSLKTIDFDSVNKVCEKIIHSNKVIILGTAFSNLSALNLFYKLIRVGIDATSYSDPELIKTSINLMGESDILIAFSQAGENLQTLNNIRLAKKLGVFIIGITSAPTSSFGKLCDLKLIHPKNELKLQGGSLTGSLSQLFIIEILYSKIVLALEDKAYFYKEKILEY